MENHKTFISDRVFGAIGATEAMREITCQRVEPRRLGQTQHGVAATHEFGDTSDADASPNYLGGLENLHNGSGFR